MALPLLTVRVIAGVAKGTRLASPPEGTRPLSDRAREGLFSSLADRVPGASVLDLFAGTGAVGIEALSRGAVSATFVDVAPGAVRTIGANLERTGLSERATVVRSDVRRFLRRGGPRFELCFLDPPYAFSGRALSAVLADVAAGWLASPGGTVVLSRPTRDYAPVIPVHWRAEKRLTYGDTLLILYREV